MRPSVRRLSIILLVLGLLALLLFVGWRLALQRLHGALLEALGPRATVESLDIGFSQVEVRGLRIRGERQGTLKWPADDELRAERVTVRPDLGALFSGRWARNVPPSRKVGRITLVASAQGFCAGLVFIISAQ